MKILIYFFSLMTPLFLVSNSISELLPYRRFCLEAVNNEEVFSSFKSHPSYQFVLEHVSCLHGELYLNIIQKDYPFILNYLEQCRDNDRIGTPQTCLFGDFGVWSPTTLRYMKVAGELNKVFGDLNEKEIVEIGGGYGGQCKIIHELIGFKSYTIIDLQEAAQLSQKYLRLHEIERAICLSNQELLDPISFDLLISNYAFSEISEDEQLVYIDKVINQSRYGYMTYNFITEGFGIKSLSLERFLNLISIPGREISLLPEFPLTHEANVIIIWKDNESSKTLLELKRL